MNKGPEERQILRRFKPYPAYKDSGVEWLGEIPAHWLCTRIKHRYSVQVGKMLQSEPSGPDDTMEPYLRAANIDWSGVILDDIREMWMSPADKQVFALREGDLLVSEGGDVGRSALWKGELEQCYIQNAINRVRSKGIDTTKFLYYWMYALKHAGYIDIVCNRATIAHYTAVKVADTEVALPPPDEQRAIAAFLDRETAKIDALVAKKERLIELLQEKRTVLITRAVTKGLDPNAPMKDSGVEWLGEIPAHWEVKPIRALAKPGYKTFTDGDWIESPFIRDDGIRLIQTGNIGVGVYVEQGFRYIDEHTFQSLHCTEVLPGDILICRLADPVGRACLAPNLGCRMITSVDVCILKTGSNIDPLFVVYALSAPEYLAWMGAICRGGTRDRVSRSMLGSIRIQVPPYDEQRAIATFLKRETAKIDALIAKIREGVERLKEYRTALISAAVTGKIDVREEAAS